MHYLKKEKKRPFKPGTWLCLCLLGWAVAKQAAAQSLEPLPNHPGKFAYTPAPGDRLVYQVTYPDGTKYPFTVTIKKYSYPPDENEPYPIAFNWAMGAPANSAGSIEICASCLTEGNAYKNYFAAGSNLKLEDATAVFVTGRNFYEPQQDKDKKTIMIMDGQPISFYDNAEQLGGHKVTVNGKAFYLLTKTYNNAPDMKGNRSLIIQAAGSQLILSMNLTFTIQLQHIITARQ